MVKKVSTHKKATKLLIIAGVISVIFLIIFIVLSNRTAFLLLGLNSPGDQKPSVPVEKGKLLGELPFEKVDADTRLKDSYSYSELGHAGVTYQETELDQLSVFLFLHTMLNTK